MNEPYRPTPDAPTPADASTRWSRAYAWALVHRDGLALLSFLACIALFASCAWAWEGPDGLGLICCVVMIVGEAVLGFAVFARPDETPNPEAQLVGVILMLTAFLNGLTLAVIGALA